MLAKTSMLNIQMVVNILTLEDKKELPSKVVKFSLILSSLKCHDKGDGFILWDRPSASHVHHSST
jgi:hypothetical protein